MRRLLRPAAVGLAGLLTTTVVAVAAPAHAAPDDRGAAWLTRQLTDGLVHNEQYDFDDYGLTADVAFALKAIGGHSDTVTQIHDALAAKVDSWTTGVDFGSEDVYAGSVAKATVLAQVTGGDAGDFGGVDLVQRLEDRVRDEAPVGRLEDASTTDYANVIGQALAARGLARAGSDEASAAVRFLLKQQCDKGFFRLNFAAKDAAKQGCDAAAKADRRPDTDVTALAILQLKGLPKSARTEATKRAIDNATDWLVATQRRSGAFGGGPQTEAPNANSTGLAAWALGRVGACRRAEKAAAWVKGLQVRGDVSGTPFEGERGAIAYDRAAFEDAAANGIGVEAQDQWRRATSQAAPGLSYLAC